MDKLSKSREEICKDCMFGMAIENCKACLFTNLKDNGETRDRQTHKRA